ncbi:hypothetical protein [Teredinibacter purpureus]|uniref:hypothetical protein n=1 Tax=Teredinibacter purpureus TaxID=2731756 RepID=UPI0005F79AD0|nr:hypothetical protein [Teredinibacter purpureus]
MPTIIIKVDCGSSIAPLEENLLKIENKVQEALTELDYGFLVFDTQHVKESLLDLEDDALTLATSNSFSGTDNNGSSHPSCGN